MSNSDAASTPVNIPRHVAIIMDGNGRWAKSRNLPRTAGHQKGIEAVRRAAQAAGECGVEYLTLFGFSSENWNRPADEIGELMRLLRYYLRSETADLHKNGIRLRVIGDRKRLDADIVELIENAERLMADNVKLNLTIALNYGGRQDIMNAAGLLAEHAWKQNRKLTDEEVETLFPQFLMTSGIPDPDLMIRTSGEQRISNFLIWACAYTEFYFTETLWPDFSKADLEEAIKVYAGRDRRYGALNSSQQG
jgi:undecaprenyl diphosphate synthase